MLLLVIRFVVVYCYCGGTIRCWLCVIVVGGMVWCCGVCDVVLVGPV